jgi:hypothetical protein
MEVFILTRTMQSDTRGNIHGATVMSRSL